MCEHGRVRSSRKECDNSEMCENGRQNHKRKASGGGGTFKHADNDTPRSYSSQTTVARQLLISVRVSAISNKLLLLRKVKDMWWWWWCDNALT